MQTTINFRGTEYSIERTGDNNCPIHLHGKRGAMIGLIRNVERPGHLMPVKVKYSGNLQVLPGMFTVEAGELRQVA